MSEFVVFQGLFCLVQDNEQGEFSPQSRLNVLIEQFDRCLLSVSS
jgi:hypothetical protein